jgi:hypothetical protein
VRWFLMFLEVAASMVPACATWPLGERLDSGASGLAGEWIGPPAPGSTDTVVWRFRDDGTYERLRAATTHDPGEPGMPVPVAEGWWEVYQDAKGDPRPLVCFSRLPRARGWPLCRYFEIDAVTDATGLAHRVLVWEGSVSEKHPTTESLTERAP